MFDNICIDETNALSVVSEITDKETKKKIKGKTYKTIIDKRPGVFARLYRKGSTKTLLLYIERVLNDEENSFVASGHLPMYSRELDAIVDHLPLNLAVQTVVTRMSASWLRPIAFEYHRKDLHVTIAISAEMFADTRGAFESLEEYLTRKCNTVVIDYEVFGVLSKCKKKMRNILGKPERYISDQSGHALLQNKATVVENDFMRSDRDIHPINRIMILMNDGKRNRRGSHRFISTIPTYELKTQEIQLQVPIHTGATKQISTILTTESEIQISSSSITELPEVQQLPILYNYSLRMDLIEHSHTRVNPLSIYMQWGFGSELVSPYELAAAITGINRLERILDQGIRNSGTLVLRPTENNTRIEIAGNEEWRKLYLKHSLLNQNKDEVDKVYSKLVARDDEYDWNLWRAQLEDVTYIAMKEKMILQSSVGSGKTRIIIAAQTLMNKEKCLTVVEPGLVSEFLKEFDRLKMPRPTVVKDENQFDNKSHYNLSSYTSLNKVVNNSFVSRELAKHRDIDEEQSAVYHGLLDKYSMICIDESHNLKNPKSIRYRQIAKMKTKRMMLCSGTISTGDPKNIFNQIALLTKGGNGPDIIYADGIAGPVSLGYSSLFKSLLHRVKVGESKYLDVIKSSREWCHIMDSYIVYTDKNSPKVSKSVSFKTATINKHYIEPTVEHMTLFASNLYKFSCWLTDKEQETDSIQILSRMQLLGDITNCPQLESVEKETGMQYEGLTLKQIELVKRVDAHIQNGHQVIVFTARKDTANFISEVISKHSTNYAMVANTAGENIKIRNSKLDKFRQGSADVLVGTYKAIGRGYNIPQASVVILYELFWTPDVMVQAIGRVLREQQRKDPIVDILITKGMIDEYQMDEIVDTRLKNLDIMIQGKSTGDIDYNVRSYKQVALDMINKLELNKERENAEQ